MQKNSSLSNKQICERVNEQWRLHRTSLLVNSVEESKNVNKVKSKSKTKGNLSHDEPKAKKIKATTLPSNVSRLSAAVQQAESLTEQITFKNKEIQKAVNPTYKAKAELSCLENRLASTKSEIRKAQDTLRKNLKANQKFLNTHE